MVKIQIVLFQPTSKRRKPRTLLLKQPTAKMETTIMQKKYPLELMVMGGPMLEDNDTVHWCTRSTSQELCTRIHLIREWRNLSPTGWQKKETKDRENLPTSLTCYLIMICQVTKQSSNKTTMLEPCRLTKAWKIRWMLFQFRHNGTNTL